MSLKLYQSLAGSSDRPESTAQLDIPDAAAANPIDSLPRTLADLGPSSQTIETIDYIGAMTRQLANMAQQSGARRLGLLLTLAAEEAEMHTGRRSKR